MKKDELAKILTQLVEAEKSRDELCAQFALAEPVVQGKPIKRPKRVLNEAGIKEIKKAQKKVDDANRNFRNLLERYQE